MWSHNLLLFPPSCRSLQRDYQRHGRWGKLPTAACVPQVRSFTFPSASGKQNSGHRSELMCSHKDRTRSFDMTQRWKSCFFSTLFFNMWIVSVWKSVMSRFHQAQIVSLRRGLTAVQISAVCDGVSASWWTLILSAWIIQTWWQAEECLWQSGTFCVISGHDEAFIDTVLLRCVLEAGSHYTQGNL